MKRTIPIFLTLILLSGAFFIFSCKDKVATTGTLSITAMTKDGGSSGAAQAAIYLALSKANLDNKIYERSDWLNMNGSVIFRDLPPKFYWYRVAGWDNYGAIQVNAGLDASVILWLNTPSTPIK